MESLVRLTKIVLKHVDWMLSSVSHILQGGLSVLRKFKDLSASYSP